MPCYDPRDAEAEKAKTDMLCTMCRAWEQAGKPFEMPKNVALWWEQHKKWDKKRGA